MRKAELKKILFILPSFLGICVFFIIPFGIVIAYSMMNNIVSKDFVGFANFTALFKNRAFVTAAINSLKFTGIAVPLAVVLPLMAAMILDERIPGKSKIRLALISPMMVPTASIILIWQVLFGYHGTVNGWLAGIGLAGVDWLKSDHGIWVVVILYIWKNLGYHMILYTAALAGIPMDIVDAARVDGAGGIRTFWKIKLRYIMPSIVFVTILSLASSFKIFREVYLLTGNYPYESLYMLQHFMNNTFDSMNYQAMSSAAIVIAAVLVVIIGVLFLLERHFGKDLES